MKKTLALMVAGLLAVSFAGCKKSAQLSDEAKEAFEGKVTVQDVKTSAKTPQGNPVRAYEVTVASTAANAAEDKGKERKNPTQASLIVVVGDTSVPVEFLNARYAMVGGVKVDLNLVSNDDKAIVIPVKKPNIGWRQFETPSAEIRKMLGTDKLNDPLADLVMTL